MVRAAYAFLPALVLPLLLACETPDRENDLANTLAALGSLGQGYGSPEATSAFGPAVADAPATDAAPLTYGPDVEWRATGDGILRGTLPAIGYLDGVSTVANHWTDGDYLLLDATWSHDDGWVEVYGDFLPRHGVVPGLGVVAPEVWGEVRVVSGSTSLYLGIEEVVYDFAERDGLLAMVADIALDDGSEITVAANLRPTYDD